MSHKKTFNGTASSEQYLRYFENDLKRLEGKPVFLLGDTFEFMNNKNLADIYNDPQKYNKPVHRAFRNIVNYIQESDILVFEGNHDSKTSLEGIGIDAVSSYTQNGIVFEHGHTSNSHKKESLLKVLRHFDYPISFLEYFKPIQNIYKSLYIPKNLHPPRKIIGHVHARFDNPNLRVLEPYYRNASIHLYDFNSDILRDLKTGFVYSSALVE